MVDSFPPRPSPWRASPWGSLLAALWLIAQAQKKTPLSQGGVDGASHNGLSPGDSSAVCQGLPTTKPKIVPPALVPIHHVTSLKFSAVELRAHARSLGLRNARWRNSAKKVDLVLAIRDHYKQREATN